MTPRYVVQLLDPMLATLLPKGIYNHMSYNKRPEPPKHTGHIVTHCSHVVHVETSVRDQDGRPVEGQTKVRTQKCWNPVYSGRSGFLCKMHHDLDMLNQIKKTEKTIERTEAQLAETMTKEVEEVKEVGLSYKSYSQWKWAYKSEVEVDEDYED